MCSVRTLTFCVLMAVWGMPAPTAPVGARAADEPGHVDHAATGEPDANLPPRLRTRLDRMDRELAKVHTLAAHFIKRQTTVLLRHPLKTLGNVRMAGGEVRWDTFKPHTTQTLITKDQVRIFYPEDRRMEIYPIGGRYAGLGLGLMPRMSELAKKFSIRQSDPATARRVLGLKRGKQPSPRLLPLTLTPRHKSMRKHLKQLTIVFDTQAPSLRAIHITQADDTKTTYWFSNVKLNPKIDKADLALHPPRGTRVVYHDNPKNRGGKTRGQGDGQGGGA